MPVTSVRTPRADVDAPSTLSRRFFSRREICTAAVVIPIIEAEIDRGSIVSSRGNGKNSNDESSREGIQDRRQEDSCAAV